ncbi:MAG: PAS domain S-box protein [Candidatus Hodarchaeales archaeon]|jgi:PAS domain S-box-containing protein
MNSQSNTLKGKSYVPILPESIKVLHVDDEPDFLLLVTAHLKEINKKLEILTVSDPSQVLELIKSDNNNFDIIVSDYQMPKLNGLELLEKIRKIDNDIPFIVFTGKGREEVVIQALNLGADFYIQKGSDFKVIVTQLNNLIVKSAEKKYLDEKREEAEEELRKSNELYSNILESITDGILALDKNFNYTHWNNAMEKTSKTPREVLLGKGPPWLFFPHLAEHGVDDLMKQAMDGKSIFRDEIPFTLPDGTTGFTSEKLMPLRDKNGEVRGIVEVITDITEKKAKEQDLRESEDRYKAIFENEDEPILVLDLETRSFFDVNPAAERLYGYSRDEFLQLHVNDITAEPEKTTTKLNELKIDEKFSIPYRRNKRKDGSIIQVEFTSSSYIWRGKKLLVSIVRDVTEKVQKDGELRELYELQQKMFDFMDSAIIVMDKDYKVYLMNKRALLLSGHPVEVSKQNKYVWELWPSVLTHSLDLMELAMVNGKTSFDTGIYYFSPGETHPGYVDTKFVPLHGSSGDIAGVVAIAEDITTVRKMIQELAESEKKYRDLVETMWEGVLMVDSDYNITFANKRVTEMIGFEVEEMISQHFMNFVHPIAHDIVKSELIKRSKGISSIYESILVTRDARPVPVLISASPIFTEEKMIGGIAVVTDLTKLKEAEEKRLESEKRFRLMFEYAPIGYQSLDEEGRLVVVNDKWLEILGYSRNEVIGHVVSEFFSETSKEIFNELFPKFKREGEVCDVLYDFIQKDGSFLPVTINGRVEYDEKGNFVRSHCVFQKRG